MRQKKVWRYYCDHCSKGGCSKPSMKTHESGCTLNPNRVCLLCKRAEHEQSPIAELIAALRNAGLDGLRFEAGGCPNCMLAAIRQKRGDEPLNEDNYYAWDYKQALAKFWQIENDAAAVERECQNEIY